MSWNKGKINLIDYGKQNLKQYKKEREELKNNKKY